MNLYVVPVCVSEVRVLITWGKKLLLSLSVLSLHERSRLPDGSHFNNPLPGRWMSVIIFPGPVCTPPDVDVLQAGRAVLFWMYALHRALLSLTVQLPVSSDSTVQVSKDRSSVEERSTSSAIWGSTSPAWPSLWSGDVKCPCQVLSDDIEVPVICDSLHRGPINS